MDGGQTWMAKPHILLYSSYVYCSSYLNNLNEGFNSLSISIKAKVKVDLGLSSRDGGRRKKIVEAHSAQA